MHTATHPITVLICAMGGEGGGVLMDWIVNAAVAQNFPVQSTSVPGVAQRTGATTYYLEIFPVPLSELRGREPILSLYPSVGDLDLVVASELIEVGRAMERGFVNPTRTTLIGSTHRLYSIAEKMVGGDGRYDSNRVLHAAPKMAKRAILFDVERVARESGSVLNAVLLGAIAGSGLLPIPPSIFEDAIRAEGKAVKANLAGFTKGLTYGRGEMVGTQVSAEEVASVQRSPIPQEADGKGQELFDRVQRSYPQATLAIVLQGVARLIDHQDVAYAKLYLDRLDTVLTVDSDAQGDAKLTAETGRHLALWMSYEDVIRVAQLKTRPERFERVRTEAGAKPDQIVKVTEFLKPGIEEFCSVLPPFVARPILRWAERRGLADKLQVGMHVKTTTINGFLRLWLMAKLRPLRRFGYRFVEEQTMIEGWLDLVRRSATLDQRLALEVTECARLIKGYGDTHRRGVAHFRRIVEDLVEPALADGVAAYAAVEAVAKAREAALTNPETQMAYGV
jgi:indolepyruvate ferredoxin oxidoreductase beta subunit